MEGEGDVRAVAETVATNAVLIAVVAVELDRRALREDLAEFKNSIADASLESLYITLVDEEIRHLEFETIDGGLIEPVLDARGIFKK